MTTKHEIARAIVQNIVNIYPSIVGIIGPDYEPGQRLVTAIATALCEAEARTWEEAAKDMAHGLPAIWKDALRKRCAFQAAARRAGKET
jgi:molecular chaperone DnaK (HSP70)